MDYEPKEPKICHVKEPGGRGRCGLYVPHPGPHRLLRADHPEDEARAFEAVQWINPFRYRKV